MARHSVSPLLLLVLLMLATIAKPVLGSYGDMEPGFRDCVSKCYVERERLGHTGKAAGADCGATQPGLELVKSCSWLPEWAKRQWLALVRRSCVEQCEYACMVDITMQRRNSRQAVYKYHGHWAFNRYAGLEEPASVVFSLLNALPHFARLFFNTRARFWSGHYMDAHLFFYPFISIAAWLASAVFHAHKTLDTTLVDYCCALMFLSYGLWLTVRRVLIRPTQYLLAGGLGALEAALVCYRLQEMRRGQVTYDRHMQTCIAIAVLTICIWLAWFVGQFTSPSSPFSSTPSTSTDSSDGGATRHQPQPHPWNKYRCLLCQLGFGAASLLELFDFPPVFLVLDAHSLWHLATIPLGFVWYHFWDVDRENGCELLA